MKHIFKPGRDASKPVFLMLHGTGGTEQDLLPLADMIDPEASVLSVRGNVLENGMPRFFRRLAEGVFDEEDLIFRTKELHEFLDKQRKNMVLIVQISLRLVIQTGRILRQVYCSIMRMR